MPRESLLLVVGWLACCTLVVAAEPPAAQPAATQPAIQVPAGYTVELAAGPPLVEHPLMASFDDRGRLYIAENAGLNMQRAELEEKLPNYVSRLEDTDGDGRFDKRTVFADKLTFPQGALWHDGWLYVASSGAIWRFRDRDDDGVAEVREKIVGSFGYTGNAADIHGCFLGPEGRIWWCEGRHGHDIADSAGNPVSQGKAARIFSCRPDGSQVRVHCGGGMDNPVEIDWTDESEMLGTVNILYHKRGDCLVHWMHGGVYPRLDQPQMLAEFRRTGEPLDAVHDYGHVAVSGTCRIRGAGVPPADAPTTFFVTEFNTHKVVRTTLTRHGSTFRAEVSDFLQAASDDFHPTDVLEDADGSLLVIDTGGWFRIGCPTSQIAKPNLLGSIYRIWRTAARPIADPRGQTIEWNELDGTQLVALLNDQRPAVRERAIQTLARQGDAAVPYLSRAMTHDDRAVRRNAIWALTRIGTPKAQGSVRLLGLAEKDPSVLAAAVYSAGATGDAEAVDQLVELLASGESPPQIVREAATSLGKIGATSAVADLLAAAGRDADRVLEHALIYALIEIGDRDATSEGLASDNPRIRRAALIALDQMAEGNLKRDEVAALLDTTDQPLLAATLDVISRHPGWSDELVALAGKLLAQNELSESEESLLSGSLVGMAKNEKVQELIADALVDEKLSPAKQCLLLDVMSRSALDPQPPSWIEALRLILHRTRAPEHLLLMAIGVAREKWNPQYERPIRFFVQDSRNSVQIAALGALAAHQSKLESRDFEFLRTSLSNGESADIRLAAARVLAIASLSDIQLAVLTSDVAGAGPLELKMLLAAFERTTSVEIAQQLVMSLRRASALASLTQGDVQSLLDRFPRDSHVRDLERFFQAKIPLGDSRQTATKLAVLAGSLPAGGVESGKHVFFSRQAACSACHRVAEDGGKIGPDLSKVGERRNQRDLLEALLVPSASIARGFESQLIRTTDGRTLTGLVVRETVESIYLRTSDQREVRLRRDEIEAQKPSVLSIMPAGLENTMTREELADLLAYLRSLK
ncbi:MAG: PVC-type heme-binding CxxCH protein [Pirellulaceae bacterium]